MGFGVPKHWPRKPSLVAMTASSIKRETFMFARPGATIDRIMVPVVTLCQAKERGYLNESRKKKKKKKKVIPVPCCTLR
jgi:hypothetical protein